MTYKELAVQVMDKLDEFGECFITQVDDKAALRAVIRKEARSRRVKIRTYAKNGYDFVYVSAQEPTVAPQAYHHVTSSLVPDVIDGVWKAAAGEGPARQILGTPWRISAAGVS